jgi:hypothetical protein
MSFISRVRTKCTVVNTHTDERMSPIFNPTVLEQQLSASYERKRPVGMPHSTQQYKGTDNMVLNLDFYLRTTDSDSHRFNEQFRNFMTAFLYPTEAATDVVTGGPPNMLFVWPNYVSLLFKVQTINVRSERFRRTDLAPYQQVMTCVVEEARNTRRTSESMRSSGFRGTVIV